MPWGLVRSPSFRLGYRGRMVGGFKGSPRKREAGKPSGLFKVFGAKGAPVYTLGRGGNILLYRKGEPLGRGVVFPKTTGTGNRCGGNLDTVTQGSPFQLGPP